MTANVEYHSKRENTGRRDWVGRGMFLLVSILLIGHSTRAQEQPTKWGEGEIEKVEIQIVKSRQITLPQAVRNFEKVPPRPVEPIKPVITYQFQNVPFRVRDFNPVLRPLKLKAEPIQKIYGNYLSVGIGNYTSPYAEAYITNKRSKNKSYGVKLFHRSFMSGPVDEKNSAGGHTELRLFGKTMNNNVALGGYVNLENTATYFYGYPAGQVVDRSSIRQTYNIVSVAGDLENATRSDFTYNFKAGYSFLTDHYAASESMVNLNFSSAYSLNKDKKIILQSDYYLMNRKDDQTSARVRQIFKVKPAYQFTPLEGLSLTLGANAVVENDTIGKQNGLHLYPNLLANYQLTPVVQVYSALTGDIDQVSLHTLSRENLWINSNISLFNTKRTLEFSAGLKGKAGGKVSYAAGASFAALKNLYYYQADSGKRRARFNVFYDNGTTQRTNLFAELGFSNDVFRFLARGDYYAYASDISNEVAAHYAITGNRFGNTALQRPSYRIKVSAGYNVYDKLQLGVDFVAQGGIKALDIDQKNLVTLNPAMDLNLKATYYLSKQFSAFLTFNNILSSNYQLFLNYPVRGFQALGGVSWSF